MYSGRYKNTPRHIGHLRQQCHNSKFVIFQEKRLTFLNSAYFSIDNARVIYTKKV